MPRSKSTNKIVAVTHKKGRKSEELALAHLASIGFDSLELSPTVRGPDITGNRGGYPCRIEVKSAVRYVRHKKYEFWLTEPVNPPRLSDDYVAIVAPDGRVLVESMELHLSLCRKDGRRNVSDFVRIEKG